MPGVGLAELRRMNGIVVPMPEERDWATIPESYSPVEIPYAADMPKDALLHRQEACQNSHANIALQRDPATGLLRNPRGATNTVKGLLWRPGINESVTTFLVYGASTLLVRLSSTALWTPPGGFKNVGEAPKGAALREVVEEAGIAVDQNLALKPIEQDPPDHPWDTDDRWVEDTAFVVDVSAMGVPSLQPKHCGAETTDARWFSLGEVPLDEMSFYPARIIASLRNELEKQALIFT